MSRREHFDNGHQKPEHTFEIEDRGPDYTWDDRYKMMLHTPERRQVADVTYGIYDNDRTPTIDVSYLKSHEEGKGYARRLMQNLYDTYPKHFINWGQTISPASTHLAQQFEDKYYNRTAYYTDQDFE